MGIRIDNPYTNEMILNKLPPRQQISKQDMKMLPHTCIGLVICVNKFGVVGYSTGFLVSSNLVITSAHVMFDSDQDNH